MAFAELREQAGYPQARELVVRELARAGHGHRSRAAQLRLARELLAVPRRLAPAIGAGRASRAEVRAAVDAACIADELTAMAWAQRAGIGHG